MSVAKGMGGYRQRQPDYKAKEHDRKVARLRRKVKKVKSGIDGRNEEHFRYARRNYHNRKANPGRDMRNLQIAKANQHLVGHIASAQTDYACEEPFRVPSLNYQFRKQERDRIHRENLTMAGRIIESQIRTSFNRRKELTVHSRKHDVLMDNISKLVPTDGRRGYHEYITAGYTRSANAGRSPRRVMGKSQMSSTAGPILPPLNEQRDQAFKKAQQNPRPQMPEVVTLGSAINSFIGVDLASENQEGVALLPSKEAHGSWALLAAPPGTNASPNVPPLYYLKSTKERWLSAETTGNVYTSQSAGWGACTSKWVLEDVGAGRYRMGAWRSEDTTAPGGYLCINPLGKLSVMRPPEDEEEAANAKSLFHWQIDG